MYLSPVFANLIRSSFPSIAPRAIVSTKDSATIDPAPITSDQATETKKWPPIIFSFAIAYGVIFSYSSRGRAIAQGNKAT
jgi:hypothetical protein